ncbi:MAG: FecR domain-containing protein [Vicinamibacterales bacterium]
MTADRTIPDYLWDPAAEPDPDVVALERRLAGLRFDPAANPLDVTRLVVVPIAPRRRWRRPLVAMAIAASLLIAASVGLWQWRWSWPEGRAWTLRSQSLDAKLEIGRGVTVPQADQAIANIGRIGTMRLGGGTSLELRATRGRRHRVRMLDGDMHVRVWAPPGSLVVETPAGDVIDLGCEFVLSVSGTTSAVRVLSGWVQIANNVDEVLIPAGASSEMTADLPPGTAVFDDAAAGFREAVRRVETDGGDTGAIDVTLRLARVRDVYTLLVLADRNPALAPALLARASELSAPPGDVTIGRILRGDRSALWTWSNSLPLPPPKSKWWLNWRDALPFWLTTR